VVAGENNTKGVVNTLSAPPSPTQQAAEDANTAYVKMLEDQEKKLEERRAAEVKVIEDQFQAAQAGAEDAQKRETGATSVAVARMGGYGTTLSGSGQGVMLTLAQQHRGEIFALQAKKAAAIQEAKNAIDDRMFKLAESRAQAAKDIEKEINDRKNKFFDQTLQYQEEQRSNTKFVREQAEKQLEQLSFADKVDPTQLVQLEKDLGVPTGWGARYLEFTKSERTAKTEAEQLKQRANLINLMQDIPAGKSIKFPDGSTITGMGSTDDISTQMVESSNGEYTMVAFDKANPSLPPVITKTGIRASHPASYYETSGDKKSTRDLQLENYQQYFAKTLEAKAEEEGAKNTNFDGKYDPDLYAQMRQDLLAVDPEAATKMDVVFSTKETDTDKSYDQPYMFFSKNAVERLRKEYNIIIP
jgi:hypothetical protein